MDEENPGTRFVRHSCPDVEQQIQELRDFIANPKVGERQLENILTELEQGVSEKQKCFLPAVLWEDEINLLEDSEFLGLVFLLAKSKSLKQMRTYFDNRNEADSFYLGALFLMQAGTVYFLFDAIFNQFTGSSNFRPDEDLIEVAYFGLKNFLTMACGLALFYYNYYIFGPDFRSTMSPTTVKPSMERECATFVAHCMVTPFLAASTLANMMLWQDPVRVIIAGTTTAINAILTFRSLIFFLSDLSTKCTVKSVRHNVRAELLDYIDGKLGAIDQYRSPLAKMEIVDLYPLSNLHHLP